MLTLDPPSKGSRGMTVWAIVVASINVDILACDVADRCSCRGWCACGCLHHGWPISPLGEWCPECLVSIHELVRRRCDGRR